MIKYPATAEDIAKCVLDDFDNGFTNAYGESQSSYYAFAEDDKDSEIYASLQVTKEQSCIVESEQFYSIFLCDYISENKYCYCQFELFSTDSTDVNDLINSIQNIIDSFKERNF